jgi:hypothetical protein
VPPLSVGAFHYIEIDVSVEVSRIGVLGLPGKVAAMTSSSLDTELSPITFLAVILNL